MGDGMEDWVWAKNMYDTYSLGVGDKGEPNPSIKCWEFLLVDRDQQLCLERSMSQFITSLVCKGPFATRVVVAFTSKFKIKSKS